MTSKHHLSSDIEEIYQEEPMSFLMFSYICILTTEQDGVSTTSLPPNPYLARFMTLTFYQMLPAVIIVLLASFSRSSFSQRRFEAGTFSPRGDCDCFVWKKTKKAHWKVKYPVELVAKVIQERTKLKVHFRC